MNSLFDEPKVFYGDATSVDLGDKQYNYLIHNHPNNNSFSDKDLVYFVSTKAKFTSIIKHSSKVEVIEKLEDFDGRKFVVEFNRLEKKYKNIIANNKQIGYNKIIKSIFNKIKNLKLYKE